MFAVVLALTIASVAAFSMAPAASFGRSARMGLVMQNSPGKNMKPMFDGTFKEAGAHPEKYTLEHENGARAIVDTVTATCISWITKDGKQLIAPNAPTAHYLNGAPVKGHFVPEERAKKVSFDRMIFKVSPDDMKDLEYRVDVTMREASLEYDVVIKNLGATPIKIQMTLTPHLAGAKITAMKGYTEKVGETGVATPAWDVAVGKFKETEFYAKME